MATFQARVEDYVGTITDTGALSAWLTDAARLVVSLMPPEVMTKFHTSTAIASGGTTSSATRMTMVTRANKPCIVVGPELEDKITDGNSFFYATAASPIALIKDGTVYAYPTGGTPLMWGIPHPTVLYSESSVANFPIWMESIIVLYSAVNFQSGAMTTLLADIPSPPTIATPTAVPVSAGVPVSLFTALQTAITDEDIELAGGIIRQIETIIAEWTAEQSMAIRNYTAQVQGVLGQAQVLATQLAQLRTQYQELLQLHLGIGREAAK